MSGGDRDSSNPFPEEDRKTRQSSLEAIAELRGSVGQVLDVVRGIDEKVDSLSHEMGHVKTHLTTLGLRDAENKGIHGNQHLAGRSVLVVEDDEACREVIGRVLSKLGCRTVTAADRTEADRELVRHGAFDLALVDLRLPDSRDGVDLCRWISRVYPSTALVVMSGHMVAAGLNTVRAARICKPFWFSTLEATLVAALGFGDPARADTVRPAALLREVPAPDSFGGAGADSEPTTFAETPDAIAAAAARKG